MLASSAMSSGTVTGGGVCPGQAAQASRSSERRFRWKAIRSILVPAVSIWGPPSLSGCRAIAVEDCAEVLQADRFGQMVVHAGPQAGFAGGGKGVGWGAGAVAGGGGGAVFAAAQFAGGFVPVHARHLAIHEDQRVGEALQGGQS